MRLPIRRLLVAALQVVATVAALSVLLHFIGGRQVARLLEHVDGTWLGLGMVCVACQTYVLAWRWRLICGVLTKTRPPMSALIQQTGRSLILSQLLPSWLAADAVRAFGMTQRMSMRDAARSVVCDRLIGLVPVASCGLVSLLAVTGSSDASSGARVYVPALLLAALLGAAVSLRLSRRLPLLGRLTKRVHDDLLSLTREPAASGMGLALAFAAQLLSLFSFAAFARSLSAHAPIWTGMLVLPLAQVITLMPLSVGGWGTREASIALSLGVLGADPSTGVGASILYGLSGPIVGIAVELCCAILRLRMHVQQIESQAPGPGGDHGWSSPAIAGQSDAILHRLPSSPDRPPIVSKQRLGCGDASRTRQHSGRRLDL